jgi:hypothetical protein
VNIATLIPSFVAGLLLAASAAAHRSAPVFYKINERVTISGTVAEFRFSNPHAILKLDVVAENGEMQHWTAETTSPSILRRRGWSQQSFGPGERVTLEGMPSVDGSYLVRIVRAFRADGTEIGVDHTEDAHLVERFALADPNTLVVTQQFTDPGSFAGTAARALSFTRGQDHVYPYDCDPTYGLAIDAREGPAAR